MTIPLIYVLCVASAVAGFVIGLSIGLRYPAPRWSGEAMTGRSRDEDLSCPAPMWAADEMATLRKRADDAEKKLRDHFAEAGKKEDGNVTQG